MVATHLIMADSYQDFKNKNDVKEIFKRMWKDINFVEKI
jgi:hypothetical protein